MVSGKVFPLWFIYHNGTGDNVMYDLIWERELFPPQMSNAGTKKKESGIFSVTLFRSLWGKIAEKTQKKKYGG